MIGLDIVTVSVSSAEAELHLFMDGLHTHVCRVELLFCSDLRTHELQYTTGVISLTTAYTKNYIVANGAWVKSSDIP